MTPILTSITVAAIAYAMIWAGYTLYQNHRTNTFRKECNAGDKVKFYQDEIKFFGRIARRNGNELTIEFINNADKLDSKFVHISNAYPV